MADAPPSCRILPLGDGASTLAPHADRAGLEFRLAGPALAVEGEPLRAALPPRRSTALGPDGAGPPRAMPGPRADRMGARLDRPRLTRTEPGAAPLCEARAPGCAQPRGRRGAARACPPGPADGASRP